MSNTSQFYTEWKETKIFCTDDKKSIPYLLSEIESNAKIQTLTY